ncbi:hypothetical protein [Lacinutrix chionoecetis]
MVNKILRVIKEQVKLQRLSYLQLKEIEWAHIYHDSIRGKAAIEKLPLNIGRWAGNYAFFYLLNRILTDFKPKSILELGLGESTKFISTFIDNYAQDTKHIIIEHNAEWKNLFSSSFKLSAQSEIKILNLIEEENQGHKYKSYSDINSLKTTFNLYLIDGPLGSDRFSRYDCVTLAKNFKEEDQFIILFDDYEREAEKETAEDLLKVLENKNIKFYTKEFKGNKTVLVIATSAYKYITSV